MSRDRLPPLELPLVGGRVVSDATLLRWAPKVYLAVAVGLVPWIVYLALTLPRHATATHYRLAWVGFDCFLVAAIGRTAWLGWRRRPEAELTALVTATLLLVDAWFDITTSPTTGDLLQAVLLAATCEIPAALATLYLVRRVERVVVAELRVAADAREHAAPHEPATPDSPPTEVVARADGEGGVTLEAARPAAPAGPVG